MDKFITAPEPNQAPRRSLFETPACFAKEPSRPLDFHLLVHDPDNDSSLTSTWALIPDPLVLPADVPRSTLLDALRDYLPGQGASFCSTPSLQTSLNTPRRRAPFYVRPSRPRLVAATLYLTYKGRVVPLSPENVDWYYKNAISTSDLMDRTEAEWKVLKELIVASAGMLTCFINIKGTGPNRWFS